MSTTSLTSSRMVHGAYIPSGLLLVGITIVKKEWLPFAVGFAVILSAWRYLGSRTLQITRPLESSLFLVLCFMVSLADIVRNLVEQRAILKKDQLQEFELKEKTILSHNTAIYRFKLPKESDILGLPIGQHVSIKANIDGTDVMRSYTPVSSDSTPGYFDLLIKSYPTGNISKYVAGLNIGQTIRCQGPKGAMVYTPNMVKKFGMIAGGTGITPMLQIVRAIVRGRAAGDKTEVSLIFANVNREDILLKEDLDALSKEDAGFKVYYVLNNPPEGWKGGVGFVTKEMIKEHLPAPSSDIKILMCGPPPMVRAIKDATLALGYEKARPVSKLEDQVFAF